MRRWCTVMIFCDFRGNCAELSRRSFKTDRDYFSALLAMRFNTQLARPALSIRDLCDLI